jgi:hypothetical protein
LAIAFAVFFRERGPGWAGAIALALGVGTADQGATLYVWPLVLLGVAAALMLVAAVRSRAERR